MGDALEEQIAAARAARAALEPVALLWIDRDAPVQVAAQVSVAISLKRIADAITGTDGTTGIHYLIAEITEGLARR